MTCDKCIKSRICKVKADFDKVVKKHRIWFSPLDLGTLQDHFYIFIGAQCEEFDDGKTKEAKG